MRAMATSPRPCPRPISCWPPSRSGADAGGCEPVAAGAGALGHRAGDERLHHLLTAPAARRRGRAGRIPCGDLDNGRSGMLAGQLREMLRCIRCGACMNHCPVYHAVGGHAYGWVYPGPMGSVLTPRSSASTRAATCPTPPPSAAVRGGVPGAHSPAQADAPLAREGIRAPPDPRHPAHRPRAVGGPGHARLAVPAGDPAGHGRHAPRRSRPGALLLAAAGRRLDQARDFPVRKATPSKPNGPPARRPAERGPQGGAHVRSTIVPSAYRS